MGTDTLYSESIRDVKAIPTTKNEVANVTKYPNLPTKTFLRIIFDFVFSANLEILYIWKTEKRKHMIKRQEQSSRKMLMELLIFFKYFAC